MTENKSINGIFEQFKRESSRDKVYAAIREAIFSGKLPPGERLTETQLAQSFDVSRVVIREALQRLAHEGFVVQNSYKGTHVVELLSNEVNEILSVRAVLEAEAVREAKPRLTKTDKKTLLAMAEKLDASQENPRLHIELDFQLHQKIWDLSGNQTLKRTLVHLTAPLFAMGILVRDSKRFDHHSSKAKFGVHTPLIKTIVEGSIDEAAAAMHYHIEHKRKIVGENFDEFLETKPGTKRIVSSTSTKVVSSLQAPEQEKKA